MDINQIVKEKDPRNVDKFENDKAELPPPPKKKKNFYFKSRKHKHYCKFV